jgi:hypothetical protein
MYGTAAGGKRSRQLGQQTGVMPDPFHRSLEAESTPSPVSIPTEYGVHPRVLERRQHSRQWTRAMLIARCLGYLATSPRCRLVLGCPIPAWSARSSPCGFPATGLGRCRVRDHARSIWVPGLGGLIARLSTRRAGTVERAPTDVNPVRSSVGTAGEDGRLDSGFRAERSRSA